MGYSTELRLDSRRSGAVAVVCAHGELDLATTDRVAAELDNVRDGAEVIALDLRGVQFMDTSALRIVVAERARAAREGYRFVVVRGPRKLQRLFEIAGLRDDGLFVDTPPDTPAFGSA
jgi:anti-anti-sigma factor